MHTERPSKPIPLTADVLRTTRKREDAFLLSPRRERNLESELCEREDLHQLACEAGRTGSWSLCLDTQKCTLSPTAAVLLGLPAAELTIPAEVWRSRIDPAHLARLERTVRTALVDETPFDFEFKATRSAGTEYWLHLRGAPLRDEQGHPVRVHGALVDLTAHKRDKDALERLNETLEERVAERGRELLEALEALRQSQKLEAMGQLTGGMAHDFNNLLTPIIANLEMLRPHLAGERELRLIDGALKSATSAQILVQRLLAFARRQALQTARVELPALVEGMAELLERTLEPRVRIELDLPAELSAARADPNQLELAILNLSVNARDAMPEGGILTIGAANEIIRSNHETKLPQGAYVRLSIKDTGVGMDEITRERAIEPFFTTKQPGEGTGLGLSMVDGLASQMGGAFRLSSAPGAGTVATLWLPVWSDPAGIDESVPPAVCEPHTGVALVVDDHALVRASTSEMLADLGYRVVEARSGEEAAEMFARGFNADLLVTDHVMPGMSGADLALIVRVRQPGLPVLIVSGYSDPNGVPPELVCLAKPFRPAELAAKVAQVRAACAG
ncbi:MAG: ATP-binding protein [Allosphingosinicella sp.]